jgi:pimeloyl-ACP methyl ester carboxylesterase
MPKDYHPWLKLCLREAPEGGKLLVKAESIPSPPATSSELVVLVHGYNNHAGEAGKDYQAFRNGQYNAAGLLPPQIEGLLGDCFWPGDADWSGLLDKTDFFFYPTAVRVTPDTGQRLAAFLETLTNVNKIHFVGHSLGCRVILECIKHIEQKRTEHKGTLRPIIGQVVLMAAAVPTFMVAPGGALASAFETPESVLVLHSTADLVLNTPFPVGQTVAGKNEGVLPSALSRYGPPPGTSARVEATLIENADHGDYWGIYTSKAKKKIQDKVANHVATFLKFGNAIRRIDAERFLGPAVQPGSYRTSASQRQIEMRRYELLSWEHPFFPLAKRIFRL